MSLDPFASPRAELRAAAPRIDSDPALAAAQILLTQVRSTLLLIAGIYLASSLFNAAVSLLNGVPPVLLLFPVGIGVVLAALFAGLRVWSGYQPFAAVLVGTVIYGAVEIPALLITGLSMAGLVLKGFIGLALVRGLGIAWKLHGRRAAADPS